MLGMKVAALRACTLATCLALALVTSLAAQLPPDVQADRLLLRAERQIGNGEYWPALASLDELLSLQAEHDLAIPESFWFNHAVASRGAGLYAQAAASATRYVESTGREGEHYLAALELLDAAEAAAEREAAEARRLAARREREEREAEERRARAGEMAKVAAELDRLAPGMELVVIPAGSFRMGCVSGVGCYDDEYPVHQVTIPRPFAVSKHEVTHAQWDACVLAGGCGRREVEQRRQRSSNPVGVSWDEAEEYVRWLSRETGGEYRLLSESEWEYAARAGWSTAYSWGNEIGSGRANCQGCGGRWDGENSWAPVGSFGPNAWGLYDMHGNSREWVQDCWSESYDGAPPDGSAWQSGDCSRRVVRSGNWALEPRHVRSAYREAFSSFHFGFRVARELTP